ncbi:EAL domain-containing protein [Kordiimonas sp.]|uniref:EAL domain-containing protein n=1 Tax=Kordiimonas sp. TaxID=1970157 RepID=UPI003A8FD6D0
MENRNSLKLDRLAPLFGALAPVVLELNGDGEIVATRGNVERHLGADAGAVCGQAFSRYLHPKDGPIWKLALHKLKSAPHVGPLPLRVVKDDGATGSIELHCVKDQQAGSIYMSIAPFHGQLSFGENRRPGSSAPRQFSKEDFGELAKRLSAYAEGVGGNVVDALLKLAGLDSKNSEHAAEASLWALHRLLSDAASDSAAAALSDVKRKAHAEDHGHGEDKKVAEEAANKGFTSAVRGAFIQGRNEANYVTVAGADGISEADAVKAAVYAMKRAASSKQVTTMQALTGGYEKRLERVKEQLRAFKLIVLQEKFDVALQPIVNIHDGSLHHFEALARFDGQYFAGSPFEFMCFAEDVGVIHEFDLAMTLKVVSLIKRMRRIGYNIAVAVNISGHSIQSQGFLRHFFRVLEDCSDIRDQLMFELTESSQIDDLETTNRILRRIRDFGHKVSLDDFGAGAAGLQYLRVLKVDCVKIDGVYIRKGLEDAENRSFLRSIAELCNGLGIETVGECVENETQRRFLEEIGVKYAQGWLYGKPAPVDEVLHFFDRT